MIIGKAIYAGSGGRMKPEIIVTAEAGSTLACGAQSYTLSASETTHTFTVALGTYTVTATKGNNSATKTVIVGTVAQYVVKLEYAVDVTITVSGSGNTKNCYATIDGTKYIGTGGKTVRSSDTITFGLRAASAFNKGTVTVDGTEVFSTTSTTAVTYSWDVPYGIKAVAIRLQYSSSYQATITVTTS